MTTKALLTLALAAGIAGQAGAVALKAVPQPLDAAKAYVLVEYKRVPNPYRGTPLAPKYIPQMGGLSLARYDVALADVRGLGKAKANPVPAKQLTSELFRNRPVAKTEDAFLVLMEVEPDTYVVQGWGDTSFSLGSYRFDAKPGQVVDLGIVSGAADWPEGEEPKPLNFGRALVIGLKGPFGAPPPMAPAKLSFRPRAAADMPVPKELPADRVVPVSFERGATFGNYLGGLVNRIEGVNTKVPPAAGPQ